MGQERLQSIRSKTLLVMSRHRVSARVAPQHCPILSPDTSYCSVNEVKVNQLSLSFLSGLLFACLFFALLQLIVDGDVLVDQRQAAIEREGNLGRIHSLLKAVTNAIKFAQVIIDCFQAVMSFAGNLILRFTFDIS